MRRCELDQMLEARLQATRARVEPQFLFETLANVNARHPSDPTRGLSELGNLIGFLRASLPGVPA